MDYELLKLIAASDPRGRTAIEKFLETASDEQKAALVEAVKNPTEALKVYEDALITLRRVLLEQGLT